MGLNGSIASWMDGTFPACEMGEDVLEGDFLGIRADANSRLVWFKAFAGVTAGANIHCEALAVAGMDMPAGYIDAVAYDRWRMNLRTPLPTPLAGLLPGDPLWLSTATPGLAQRTKPSVTGQFVQELGRAFWVGSRLGGINAAETANAALINILRATTV